MKLLMTCLGSGVLVCAAEAVLAESDVELLIGLASLVVAFIWIGSSMLLVLMSIDAVREMGLGKIFVASLFPLVFFCLTAASVNDDPLQVVRMPILAGDAIHFAMKKGEYDSTVRADQTQVRVFVWAGDVVGEDGIAYDRSGLLARTGELTTLCQALPLWDHYYFVRFGC